MLKSKLALRTFAVIRTCSCFFESNLIYEHYNALNAGFEDHLSFGKCVLDELLDNHDIYSSFNDLSCFKIGLRNCSYKSETSYLPLSLLLSIKTQMISDHLFQVD